MRKRMTRRGVGLGLAGVALVLAVAGCGPEDPAAEFRNSLGGPAGPTFKVEEVVAAEKFSALAGPDYALAPTVTVYEDKYLFDLQTPDGQILALGRNMFDLRLNEIAAIERAREMGGVSHVFEGTTDAAGNIIGGVGALLLDPVGTFERVPEGIDRVVDDEWDSTFGNTAGKNQRVLAARLGCDPESRNPILQDLMFGLRLQKGIGSLPVMVVPYTGGFTLVTWMQAEMTNKPPRVISEEIEAELVEDGIDPELAKTFSLKQHFTTLQRLMFMEQYRKLNGLAGAEVLLTEAVESRNEAEALAAMETARMLADLHGETPIVRLDHLDHPIAVLDDGSTAVCYSADYIVGDDRLATRMRVFRDRYPDGAMAFVCSGRVSPEAQVIFDALNIDVVENR